MTDSMAKPGTAISTTEIEIVRVFDAPRALVWRAWTDPQHFMRWWGPEHFTCPTCQLDLRVGGKYFHCMQSPEGQQFWSTGEYKEIVPQERLVFTDCFADEQGNVVSAAHYGMDPDFPLETLVTVTFEDLGSSKTRMTFRHTGIPAGEDRDMAQLGWSQSFDKLAADLQ